VLDTSNSCQRLVAGLSHTITDWGKARKTYLISQFCFYLQGPMRIQHTNNSQEAELSKNEIVELR